LRALFIALVAVTVLAAACTDTPVAAPTTTTTAPIRVERAAGFDAELVRLGVLADLSGPDAEEHGRRLAGVEVVWASLNAAGGFDDRYPVELVVRDHGGDAAAAASAYREIADDVAAFALVAGDDAFSAVLPLAGDDGVQIVPGDRFLTRWGRGRVLAVGTSEEAIILGALQHLGEGPPWCAIVDGSKTGVWATETLPVAAELSGLAAPALLLIDAEHPPAEAVAVAADQGCRVWLEADPVVANEVAASLPDSSTLAVSGRLAALMSLPEGPRIVIAADTPAWEDSSPGMAELIESLEIFAPDVVGDHLVREGYVSQLLLQDLLSLGIERGDLRRSSLDAMVAELGATDRGGLVTPGHPALDPPPVSVRIFEYDPAGDALGWRFVVAVNAVGVDALAERLLLS
jgi:hypothetical protein